MQGKIEIIIVSIIAVLCIVISILDFLGALEGIVWITQRISIMTLLAIGMIAIYLVSQHSRNFKRLEDTITKGDKEILNKIVVDDRDKQIIDSINNIWNEREDEIEELFQKVAEIPASQDNKELIEFLKNCDRNFDNGNVFGTKYKSPWDFDIVAVNFKGVRIYHTHDFSIGTKYHLDHPTWDILKKRNGTVLWINRNRGKFNRLIENFPMHRNLRYTKIYFREIPHLNIIIIFQSHINIISNLLKTKND